MIRLACSLAAAAVFAIGCGDSDDEAPDPQAPASAPPAQTTTGPPSTAAPAPAKPKPEKLAPAKRRLKDAGFDEIIDTGIEGVEPPPEAALEFPLDGGGQMTVFAYASPEQAKEKAAEFEPMARRYPDYFRVVVKGSTTYLGVAEQPDTLDGAAFDKAVDAAEG